MRAYRPLVVGGQSRGDPAACTHAAVAASSHHANPIILRDQPSLAFINAQPGGTNQLSRGRKEHTSGAKARTTFNSLMARVNSCPSRSIEKSEFPDKLFAA